MTAAPLAAGDNDRHAQLRELELLRQVPDSALDYLAQHATWCEVPRDTQLPPELGAVCLIVRGQLSLGVFDREALADRSRPQRDAARGEKEGTLMPPGPLARVAKQNLALFLPGEVLRLSALPPNTDDELVVPFSLTDVTVLAIGAVALEQLARDAPEIDRAFGAQIALTRARLGVVTGIKHEVLDFYVRHGMSVSGAAVRIRQLDLCIDCKQCEEACEDRHGAQRLTLGGYELGLVDVVYTCRTCTDARCLSPCEHDAIKRDAATGEIKIVEDRCIGCSLCALSCPYGAINMVNVVEPELPSHRPAFKARLDKTGKLSFGPGKGRKSVARRIANKCDHCAGYGDQACVSACPTGSLIEISPATLFRERTAPEELGNRKRLPEMLPMTSFTEGLQIHDSGAARVRVRRLSRLLWFLGIAPMLAIVTEILLRWLQPTWSVSFQILLRDGLPPEVAEMNVSYLAGTKLALTCGYVGTLLMVLSMAYLLQRRFGWFSRTATNQFWLDVHLMTGIVGPAYIAIHSALHLTTWVSIPFWSMVAVVGSGIIGRYLYTLVPRLTNGHDLALLEHRRAITELAADNPAATFYAYQVMEREAASAMRSWQIGLVPLLAWVVVDDVRRMFSRRRDRRALRRLASRSIARRISRHIDRVVFFERRRELAPRSKALLKSWKRVHIPFSLVLLVTMLLHIAIAWELL